MDQKNYLDMNMLCLSRKGKNGPKGGSRSVWLPLSPEKHRAQGAGPPTVGPKGRASSHRFKVLKP